MFMLTVDAGRQRAGWDFTHAQYHQQLRHRMMRRHLLLLCLQSLLNCRRCQHGHQVLGQTPQLHRLFTIIHY